MVDKIYLARRNTENLLGYWTFLSQSPKFKLIDNNEMTYTDIGLTKNDADFVPQAIWKVNLPKEKIHQRINEIINYYTSQDKPFFWYVCNLSQPTNLGEILKTHSFNEMDATPVMAASLTELRDDRKVPENVTISEATHEDEIRLWWDLWVKGYPQPPSVGKRLADASVDIGYHPDNALKFYLGYVDGEPSGTSKIFLDRDVAGLYGVTVLQEARGNGLGTELSMFPFRVARSMGLTTGVLDATKKGHGLYKRMGFEEINTPKIYVYSESESQENRLKNLLHTQRN